MEDVGVRVELESLDELLRAREILLTMLVALLLASWRRTSAGNYAENSSVWAKLKNCDMCLVSLQPNTWMKDAIRHNSCKTAELTFDETTATSGRQGRTRGARLPLRFLRLLAL